LLACRVSILPYFSKAKLQRECVVGFRSNVALLAVVAALVGASPAIATAGDCPAFEVGVVARQGDGAQMFKTPEGISVAVSSPALVSARDVVGAEVSSAEGRTGLSVRVDAQAAERVRSFTASHVGARLAFIVDGRVQSVVKVLDPITRDGFWVSPMAPDTAGRLASAFSDCARETRR
jgi:hypothetical protein